MRKLHCIYFCYSVLLVLAIFLFFFIESFQYSLLGSALHLMWRLCNMLAYNWYMMGFLSFCFILLITLYLYSFSIFEHDISYFIVALSFFIVFILYIHMKVLKIFSLLMNFFCLVMLLQMLKISITNVILVSHNLFLRHSCVPHHLCF